MITIKKGTMKFEFENAEATVSQDTPSGMYFKFRDGSELILNCEKVASMKAIPMMIMKSTSKNVLIDLNNARSPISFV